MLSLQAELYQELPSVFGSKDSNDLQALLKRIDELLEDGGLDSAFVMSFPAKARKTQKQRWHLMKARVHHPVDWVLLRDVVRTLTLAIVQARKHGAYSRMPKAPGGFGKKRKTVLHRMKKQVRATTHFWKT